MRLAACGSNSHGQLGLNHAEDVNVFTDCDVSAFPAHSELLDLSFGATHTLALVRDSAFPDASTRVYGCGNNTSGQLSFGQSISAPVEAFRPLPLERLLADANVQDPGSWNAVTVCACWDTSFIVLRSVDTENNDIILSFGANDWGERGSLQTTSTASLVPIPIQGKYSVLDMRAGTQHVLARIVTKPEGRECFVGWGAGRHGQLSFGESERITPPHVFQFTAGTPKDDVKVLAYDAARTHSSFLTLDSSGSVSLATYGLVKNGPGSKNDRYWSHEIKCAKVVNGQLSCSWSATHALVTHDQGSHSLCSIGRLFPSEVESGETNDVEETTLATKGPIEFVAGSEHMLMLDKSTGSLRARGWNEHGNLSTGSNTNEPDFVDVSSLTGKVERVWAGSATTWALLREE